MPAPAARHAGVGQTPFPLANQAEQVQGAGMARLDLPDFLAQPVGTSQCCRSRRPLGSGEQLAL